MPNKHEGGETLVSPPSLTFVSPAGRPRSRLPTLPPMPLPSSIPP